MRERARVVTYLWSEADGALFLFLVLLQQLWSGLPDDLRGQLTVGFVPPCGEDVSTARGTVRKSTTQMKKEKKSVVFAGDVPISGDFVRGIAVRSRIEALEETLRVLRDRVLDRVISPFREPPIELLLAVRQTDAQSRRYIRMQK